MNFPGTNYRITKDAGINAVHRGWGTSSPETKVCIRTGYGACFSFSKTRFWYGLAVDCWGQCLIFYQGPRYWKVLNLSIFWEVQANTPVVYLKEEPVIFLEYWLIRANQWSDFRPLAKVRCSWGDGSKLGGKWICAMWHLLPFHIFSQYILFWISHLLLCWFFLFSFHFLLCYFVIW